GANVFNSFITNAGLEEVSLAKYKDELEALEVIIDKGDGNVEVVYKRLEVVNTLQKIDKICSSEMAQKAKVELESDVSNEEIKRAVWDCGIGKSLGPDGFTFGFYHRFWNLIENDVHDAIKYFFTYGVIPKGCNSSFIALIPKIPDANAVKDFRPISLIGSLYKIIAKILANRLVGVLGDIVNEVDFEIAYDSVRWDFLDDILKKFGFGEKWCKWIQSCLRSSRGSIIINSSPTKEFQFFKGLKQGIKLSSSLSISHMFYADDAVFVGQQCDGVLVDSDKVKYDTSKLGCLILKTSFSYLRSKVGGSMSRVHTWNEVVDRVKNWLSKCKMKTLSIGGRLTLLKSVLGSMPIFHMSIFRAPLTVLRTLESIRIQFFKGQELNSKKASWVNWKKVLDPKEKGGLGVSSLYALNRGLMFKWMWRFYTQNTSLWVRVINPIHGDDGKVGGYVKDGAKSCWLSIVNEINSLKNKGINLLDFMHVKLGNGDKTAFWEDIWIEDRWIWALESSGDFFCCVGAETSSHLLFSCCMARQIVRMITRWWDVPYGEVDSYEDWINWFVNLRLSYKHKQMLEGWLWEVQSGGMVVKLENKMVVHGGEKWGTTWGSQWI
nr:RNA-directed DNA polymerase, eukaryota [Tanacetum cinerariifolium]